MKKFLSKNAFTLISSATAVGASVLVRKLINKTTEKKTGKKPPLNPNHEDYKLKEVLLYSAATAVVGATAKVLLRHLTTKKWKKMGGELPDGLE